MRTGPGHRRCGLASGKLPLRTNYRRDAAHEQAFAQLTPDQRRQVLQQLAEAASGQPPQDDSPKTLDRSATRMEMQRPGAIRSMFGGGTGRGMGMGAMIGGALMGSIAGAFIGTAIAQEMFDGNGFGDGFADNGGADETAGDPGEDAGDPGAADQGFAEDPGMDQGMDDGFGGADFVDDMGGGDFGGGDIGGF